MGRLVLSRTAGERVVLTLGGERVEVTVAGVNGRGRVWLRFDAPAEVVIDREEIDRKKALGLPPSGGNGGGR